MSAEKQQVQQHLFQQLSPPTTVNNIRTSDCSLIRRRCAADSASYMTHSLRPMHSRDHCDPTAGSLLHSSRHAAPPTLTYIDCQLPQLQYMPRYTALPATRCCGLHRTAAAVVSPSWKCTETSNNRPCNSECNLSRTATATAQWQIVHLTQRQPNY